MTTAGVPIGESLPLLVHIEAETWLANRLADHGCDIYDGGPYATYAERLGACILRNGLPCVIVGRKDGKPESYAACFERIFGQPLVPKASRKLAKEGA